MARFRIRLLLIVAAAMWMKLGVPTIAAAPFPNDCNNVCTTSQSCTHACYPDFYSFQNDLPITCMTWGIYESPCCGDYVCDSGEPSTCSGDCPPTGCEGEGCEEEGVECGDDVCEGYETCSNCPDDCGDSCICGDYICDTPFEGGGPNDDPCDETDVVNGDCHYCAADCGACEFSDCEDEGVCDDETGLCRPCYIDMDCPNPGYFCSGSGTCETGNECNYGTYPSTGCPPNQLCNSNNVRREVV